MIPMTITEALRAYKDIEADLLVFAVLNKPKEFLYLSPHTELTPAQGARLERFARQRRAGKPIAYILGHKYFYGLKFKVNKHVLIPRPETEWLVERTGLRVQGIGYRKSKKAIRILDVGTGSGCIAISIAHALSAKHLALSTRIAASDISEQALVVAQQNARTHKANIQFVQSDLFKRIRGTYDIIIANLQYVPQGMYELLYHNLKYEPKVAITDGGEVWDVYRRFFSTLPKHLAPGGTVLMEMDDGAKPAMQAMVKNLLPGYKVRFVKDLGGLWRFIEITAPLQ